MAIRCVTGWVQALVQGPPTPLREFLFGTNKYAAEGKTDTTLNDNMISNFWLSAEDLLIFLNHINFFLFFINVCDQEVIQGKGVHIMLSHNPEQIT